ncbi:hypothetical protein [Pedobacter punctiformis]|uniref:Uncharacterized protein n=1 Tax=Pedobacter punctiformis TaxID=3004097 RepID=A0ABT4LBH1_9SPHI|nr:hypothetical protein [Pedobacter sp. HCMS5-2]MCZ4245266.1 hypothetical protein [Pedobacter sp. HCMS5-2]
MFLPLFIAILLGLATPSNTNHSGNCNGTTTTVTTADSTEGDPSDPGDTDPGEDTGGETGHTPIKN